MQLTESRLFHLARKSIGFKDVGWIGIDIGQTSITLAQVKKKKESYELLNYQVLPLDVTSCSSCVDDDTSDEDAPHARLVDSVTETVGKNRLLFSLFEGRDAACTLPLSIARMQSIRIPDGEPAEIQLMVQQELQMQLNEQQAGEEFIFWKENFNRQGDDGLAQVSVVTAPGDDVLQVAQLLLKSSIHCQLMTALPLVISRAMELHHDISDQSIKAGFYWGMAGAVFVIVQNGAPVFTRTFRNCGFDQITRLLEERMGLTEQESLQLLKNYQSPTQPEEMKKVGQAIAEIIVAPVKVLSREFQKTLDFISQKRPDLIPNRMLVLGVGSGLSQAEMLLTHVTGIKTGLWHLPAQNGSLGHEMNVLQSRLGIAIALSTMAYNS